MSKLTRDESNGKVFGVCSGLANYFESDATIIRLLFVLATIFGLGSPILIYVILAIIMKEG